MRLNDTDMKRLAALGAEVELARVVQQARTIVRQFPTLRPKAAQLFRTLAPAHSGNGQPAEMAAATAPEPRSRRALSKAARAKISKAQRERWRKYRAEGGKAGAAR